MRANDFTFEAQDGVRLLGRRWLPEGAPRAVVQIAHGLAEHSARYARLAAALNAAGYAAYAFDLRGHGPSAAPAELGHFADRDGWAKVVGDCASSRSRFPRIRATRRKRPGRNRTMGFDP